MLKVHKAEIIISVEEKMSNYGGKINEEYDILKRVDMELKVDPHIQRIMDNLTEFGVINIER